jgi:hypothetical protein
MPDDMKSAFSADPPRQNRRRWEWTTFANGRLYRPVMKVMHRLGWCYPEPAAVEPGARVWCRWCGMRGRR